MIILYAWREQNSLLDGFGIREQLSHRRHVQTSNNGQMARKETDEIAGLAQSRTDCLGGNAGLLRFYIEPCLERPLPRETTCLERPHIFGRRSAFQCNRTCYQRLPVLTDHLFVANGVIFQDRFYCTRNNKGS